MRAERFILTTDSSGNLPGLPKLPPNQKVEAILLLLDPPASATKRQPHPDLIGSAIISGEVFSSADPDDWFPLP